MNWNSLTTVEQMANIGAEVGRTINWRNKNKNYSKMAFYRALDLFDKTIADFKNRQRLGEICRAKEALTDWFLGNSLYNTTDEQWQNYFYSYNYLCGLKRD